MGSVSRKNLVGVVVLLALLVTIYMLWSHGCVETLMRTFGDVRHKACAVQVATDGMDNFQMSARLALEAYLRETDIEKLDAIRDEFLANMALHDECEKQTGKAIENMPMKRSQIIKVWQDAMETITPEFVRQANLTTQTHKEHLEVKGQRTAKMNQHEEQGEELKRLLCELRKFNEYDVDIMAVLSQLDSAHFEMMHANGQLAAKIEGQKKEHLRFKETFTSNRQQFGKWQAELEDITGTGPDDELLQRVSETFDAFVFSAVGDDQLFQLHEREVALRQKAFGYLARTHELGEAGSRMSAEIIALSQESLRRAVTHLTMEIIVSAILFVLVCRLWQRGKAHKEIARNGWNLIFGGVVLLLIGSLFDITDNFETLNRYIIVGNTGVKAFFEKIVGFLGGFLLLSIGLLRWLPSITSINELRKQKDFLEITIDSLDYPFYVIDADDFTVKLANKATKQLPGWYEGVTCHELTHNSKTPCDCPEHRCPLGEIKRTKKPVILEHDHCDINGNSWSAEVHGYPVFDEKSEIKGVIEYSLNISERKEAECALQKQTDLLNNIISHIPHYIFWKDRQSVFAGCNKNFAEAAGYERPEDIVGKTDYDLPWKKEEADWFRKCDRDVMDKNEEMLDIEETQLRADGKKIDLLTSKVPLRDDEGKVIGILGLYSNVTKRKRAEKELEAARLEAESANEAKSRFLANMSHEIRTPMNSIISLSKTLGKHNTGNLTQRQKDGLRMIHQSGERLLLLINDILDLSKVESGKIEAHPEAFYLDEVIETIETLARNLIGDSPIDFVLEKSDGVGAVIVSDSLILHQILVNIVGNAIKFTEEGRIVLKIYPQDEKLFFEVTDSGIGISRDDLETIFAEFTQVDSSLTRKYRGTGLGLAICKKMLELLDGDITAESQPGQWTKITFHIPLLTAESSDIESTSLPATSSYLAEGAITASKAKVLVAEDDEFGRAAVEMMLEGHYNLAFAANGKEVVDKYFDLSPDIVLMDIMMPVMDGFQAFDEIRKRSKESRIPIIAVTAKTMKKDRRELFRYGFTDFISKPIDDELLIKTIDKYLARTDGEKT